MRKRDPEKEKEYWLQSRKLICGLLCVWFIVSYGAGILFRDALDNLSLGGAPLGFWMSQNGAIYVFIALIFIYCYAMDKLEKRLGITENEDQS